jgi:hypothetical protein
VRGGLLVIVIVIMSDPNPMYGFKDFQIPQYTPLSSSGSGSGSGSGRWLSYSLIAVVATLAAAGITMGALVLAWEKGAVGASVGDPRCWFGMASCSA